MTDLQSLQQLRERVSKLEGPSDDVDRALWLHFEIPYIHYRPFTASIDAALGLVERVLGVSLNGLWFHLSQEQPDNWLCELGPSGPNFAKTPAIAILFALLDALISEKAKAEEPA